MPVSRSYVSERYSLVLEGVNCGFIRSAEGGNVTADVIKEPPGPSYFTRKHLGQLKYEDFELELGFQLEPSVFQWIASSWNGNYQRKDGAVIAADFNLNAQSQREFFNALITETTIPACDGSSKEPAYMTLKFAPEHTRYTKASGKLKTELSKTAKLWAPSNFKLEIDGLDCTRVSKIESFTVRQAIVKDEIGDLRDYAKEPGKLEFPNLIITLAENSAQSWYDFHESFVIKGNNDESHEKNGTLVLLSATMTAELARINFFNLGIFKLASEKSGPNTDQIKRIKAELYCERMEFVYPGAIKNKRALEFKLNKGLPS